MNYKELLDRLAARERRIFNGGVATGILIGVLSSMAAVLIIEACREEAHVQLVNYIIETWNEGMP